MNRTEIPGLPLRALARSDDSVLRATEVRKLFGRRVALDGLTLDVRRGDVFGLLGTNGAGKTTFLRIAAALLRPSAGAVEVFGYPQELFPARARRMVGYMPDSPGILERVTTMEYLEFYALISGIPYEKRQDRIAQSLEAVGLLDRLDEETTTLSRGMLQRLALARLLLRQPELLLLDEPLSGLDPRGRIEILRLLRGLADAGSTIVISSHVLHDLERFCTRLAVLEGGGLRFSGTVAEAKSALRTAGRYTARLREGEEAAARLIASVPGVLETESAPDERGRRIRFRMRLGSENPAEVAARLVAGGFGLLELTREETTLEEVFLHFTEGRVT